jgi:hypothetical protein
VFLQKSVQAVEKKGWELRKERQERRKSLQEYENNEFTIEVTEKAGGGEGRPVPHTPVDLRKCGR